MLLEKTSAIPDTRSDRRKTGWSRPIYVLRRGLEIFCGHLDREGGQYALLSNTGNGSRVTFRTDEPHELSRVDGVAVPV